MTSGDCLPHQTQLTETMARGFLQISINGDSTTFPGMNGYF